MCRPLATGAFPRNWPTANWRVLDCPPRLWSGVDRTSLSLPRGRHTKRISTPGRYQVLFAMVFARAGCQTPGHLIVESITLRYWNSKHESIESRQEPGRLSLVSRLLVERANLLTGLDGHYEIIWADRDISFFLPIFVSIAEYEVTGTIFVYFPSLVRGINRLARPI